MASPNDAKFSRCTAEGQEELRVYLEWIHQNGLPDTEFSFVAFALGRAQIQHPRDLFEIWEELVGQTVEANIRLQTRRFLMNPSREIDFSSLETAGWFNFLPAVYQAARTKTFSDLTPPDYRKVGFAKKG